MKTKHLGRQKKTISLSVNGIFGGYLYFEQKI